MSTPAYGWVPSRGAYVAAQADDIAKRQQQAENSGRMATQQLTYDTTGVGQIVVPGALRFDTTFLVPPAVATGCVLIKAAGDGWTYPQVTAGVYRWLTNDKGYIIGAYLYFTISCGPSDLDSNPGAFRAMDLSMARRRVDRSKQSIAVMSPMDRDNYQRAFDELTEATYDLRSAERAEARGEAQPVITHHLSFLGLAMKELPESVTGEW